MSAAAPGFPGKLDLVEFFTGRASAWGMVVDRRGRVRRRFHVDIEGVLRNGCLMLDESFRFDDGATDMRLWTIDARDGSYVGTASDVLGAASGTVAGPLLNWSYDLLLPVGRRRVRVRFDDWMALADDDVMLSRGTIRKFGLRVAEVIIAFRRGAPGAVAA